MKEFKLTPGQCNDFAHCFIGKSETCACGESVRNSNIPPKHDWAIREAIEALAGMQGDCEAMMKLTPEERDSLVRSVAAALREVRARYEHEDRTDG